MSNWKVELVNKFYLRATLAKLSRKAAGVGPPPTSRSGSDDVVVKLGTLTLMEPDVRTPEAAPPEATLTD